MKRSEMVKLIKAAMDYVSEQHYMESGGAEYVLNELEKAGMLPPQIDHNPNFIDGSRSYKEPSHNWESETSRDGDYNQEYKQLIDQRNYDSLTVDWVNAQREKMGLAKIQNGTIEMPQGPAEIKVMVSANLPAGTILVHNDTGALVVNIDEPVDKLQKLYVIKDQLHPLTQVLITGFVETQNGTLNPHDQEFVESAFGWYFNSDGTQKPKWRVSV